MSAKFIRLAALLGTFAVSIGAFGAHGLKGFLERNQIDPAPVLHTYETGVQYHFYHTLAIGLVGLLLAHQPENKWLIRAGWLFLAGIVGFSGSLYLLATQSFLPFPVRWVGPITPLGGLFFIAGWLSLLGALRNKRG